MRSNVTNPRSGILHQPFSPIKHDASDMDIDIHFRASGIDQVGRFRLH